MKNQLKTIDDECIDIVDKLMTKPVSKEQDDLLRVAFSMSRAAHAHYNLIRFNELIK